MQKEHKNIENYDWRLQAVTTVNGNQHWFKDWDPIVAIWQFALNNSVISFLLPNMSAIFLEFANKSFIDYNGLIVKSVWLK
jgi:hypothetical protein